MAFFDFLKPKEKPKETITHANGERTECDIAKTQVIDDLVRIPREQRDEKWQNAFLEAIPTASFACGNPQVFNGPDGFPYFALHLPEPNKPFESFCIRNMKDDFLLERGIGVAINPKETSVDWAFSYGDIVNFHLNGEFFSQTDTVDIKNEEILKQDEKILVAQPSESYLPLQTRKALKSYLQHIGIEQPKMAMVCRTIQKQPIKELVFNIFPEDFESVEQLNVYLQHISWFLPKHYIVLSTSRDSGLEQHFADL